MSPEAAPEIIMDANGFYWRRYPTHLSMVPTTDDNEAVSDPYVVYLPASFGEVYWRTLALAAEAMVARVKDLETSNREKQRLIGVFMQQRDDTEDERDRALAQVDALREALRDLADRVEKCTPMESYFVSDPNTLEPGPVRWQVRNAALRGSLSRARALLAQETPEPEEEA